MAQKFLKNIKMPDKEKIQIIAEITNDFVYEWNIADNSVNWFGDFEKTLGYKKGDIPKTIDAWLQLIHPDDYNRIKDITEQHRQSASPFYEEYRVRHKNGSWHNWLDRALPIVNEQGQPVQWVGACLDITATKTAKETAQRYFDFLDTIPDGIVILDLSGIIKQCNQRFLEMTDFTENDVIGKHFTDIPFLKTKYIPGYLKIFKSIVRRKKVRIFEFEWTHRDGTERICEARYKLNDTSGKTPEILLVLRDITVNKHAKLALEESEKKWRRLFENLRDGIFITDLDGNLIECNRSYLNILGYTLDELKALKYEALTPAKWHKFEKEVVIDQILKKGYSGIYEKEYIRKDQTIVPIEISAYLRQDTSGNPIGIWGIVRDITVRKTALEKVIINEYLYRLTLASISDSIFVTDEAGSFTFICPGTETIFGYNKDEVNTLGNVQNLIGTLPVSFEEIGKTGEIADIEHRIRDKNNIIHDLLISIKMVAIGQGSRLYTCHDITMRKKVENLWRLNREILEKNAKGVSLGKIFDNITNHVDELLPGASSSIFLTMPDNKHIHLLSGPHLSKTWQKTINLIPVGKDNCASAAAAYFGKRIIVPNISRSQYWKNLQDEVRAEGFSTCWSQPIFSSKSHSITGVFTIYFKHPAKPGDYETHLLENIAELINLLVDRKRDEDRVLEERELLYNLFDNLPGTVYLQAPDYKIRFANKRFIEEFGSDFSLPCYKLIHGLSAPCPDCPTFAIFKTGKPLVYEWTLENGKTYLTYDYPFKDTDNTPLILEYSLDISDRKKIEQELRESEQRYRAFYNSTNDMIFIKDHSFRYLMINLANQEFFGKNESEIIGKTDFDLMSEKAARACRQSDEQAITENQVLTDIEVVGNQIYETRKFPVPIGKTIGVGGLIRNITQERTTEEELKTIFNLAIDMICIADINTATFTKVNPAFIKILGYTEDEILSKSFLDFIHPDDRQKTIDIIENNLKNEIMVISFENRYRTKNGQYIWLDWVSHPIPEKGLTYAIAHNITDRKKSENALKEKIAELEQMNKFMVGRENRMVELKQEVNELCKMLKITPRYKDDY